VAAYSPRGSYGAAKSWVLSFTRWANLEYRRDGVTVSAVAPGFVRTEFHERMRVRTDTIPSPLWLHPPRVVRAALAGARRGRAVEGRGVAQEPERIRARTRATITNATDAAHTRIQSCRVRRAARTSVRARVKAAVSAGSTHPGVTSRAHVAGLDAACTS